MKKLLASFMPKDKTIKEIVIQYEMFNTNCTYEHAEEKSNKFFEYKKTGLQLPL